jgi:hypothetical protein
MAPEPEKEYTMEEVSKHNKVDDCWLVIGNDATGKTQMIYSPFPGRRKVVILFLCKYGRARCATGIN